MNLLLVDNILILVLDWLLENLHLSEFVLGKHIVSFFGLDTIALVEFVGRVAELTHFLKRLIYFFEIFRLLTSTGQLILRSFLQQLVVELRGAVELFEDTVQLGVVLLILFQGH